MDKFNIVFLLGVLSVGIIISLVVVSMMPPEKEIRLHANVEWYLCEGNNTYDLCLSETDKSAYFGELK